MRATVTILVLGLAVSGCGRIMSGGHSGVPVEARTSENRSLNLWTLGNAAFLIGAPPAFADTAGGGVGAGLAMVALGVGGLAYDYYSGGMWNYSRESVFIGRPWPDHFKRAVIDRRIMTGMTPEMVRASWGPPQRVNRTDSPYGIREQWVYGMGEYIYFEDGVVTTIQTSRQR